MRVRVVNMCEREKGVGMGVCVWQCVEKGE